MKLFASLFVLAFASVAIAQDCAAPAQAKAGVSFVRSAPASQSQVRPANLTELTAAEKEFQRTGPQLFTMDEALALQKKTGAPIACWISTSTERVFADPKAREGSRLLSKTTIQAVMTDLTNDSLTARGPRVQVSDSDYGPTAKTVFVPVKDLTKKKVDDLLAFARGAK